MNHQTWYLDNVREIAKEAPYTFYVPSEELIQMLEVGDLVKLMFVNGVVRETDQYTAERMWVEITQIDGDCFVGRLDNDPYEIQNLVSGAEIDFKVEHIMDVAGKEDPAMSLVSQYAEKCLVTSQVLFEAAPIRYMCRTEQGHDEDSGWQIMAGDESDEYLDNVNNWHFVDLGRLLNLDDSFIHLLSADTGKAFMKNEQGEWGEVLE